jgi:hypothetical protein
MAKVKSSPQATDTTAREVSMDEMVTMLEVQQAHYQEQANRLARVISELMGTVRGNGGGVVIRDGQAVKDAPLMAPKRGQLSAAARKKISQAQKKRWAALKSKGTTVATV